MSNYLRKIWIALFTNNPYKTERFEDIYAEPVGLEIDRPESLSGILKHENGELINYSLPPITYNQEINYRYIDKKPRFKRTGIFKSPDRYLYSISNGRIIGQTGLVYDPEKRSFINESAKEWTIDLKNSAYVNAVHLPALTSLKGITFSFLTLGADGGFYHFLFESLIKSAMYQHLLVQADNILFNGPRTDWKLKWAGKANIDHSKIIWADNTGHYACEQLLFTNKLINDQQISKWCIDSLKTILDINPSAIPIASKKILWISRKGSKDRDILWEDEILKLYPEMESVDLSRLSADETVSAFQQATHIIGPHGAGLSNIYLCGPGAKILEIYPDGAVFQPCYHRLSAVCGLEHGVLYLDFKSGKGPVTGMAALTGALTKFLC